jgi:hypothetical protein
MLFEIIYCPHDKCLQSLIALLLWVKSQTVWAVSNKTIGLFLCLARADGRYQGFALIGKNCKQMNTNWQDGVLALCKRLVKTGNGVTLAFSPRYGHLII